MKTIRKLRMLLVLALIGWASVVLADDEIPSSGTYNLIRDVYLTKTLTLTGNLTITTSGNFTIHRKNFNGYMIKADHYNLTITGASNKKIVIDGGAVWPTQYDATTGPDDPDTFTNHQGTGGIIHINNGALNVSHTVFQNFFQGSAMWVSGDETGAHVPCNITDVEIKGGYGWNVGMEDFYYSNAMAFYFPSGDYHTASFQRVEIHHCKACYGIIRTNGGTGTILTMDNCYVHDNYTVCGGVTYWNAAHYPDTKLTIQNGCRFMNNTAIVNGAALFIESRMELNSATIVGNTADQYGGGLYVTSLCWRRCWF